MFLALSEKDDDNPFQDVGLDSELIFSLKDTSVKGRAQQKIERILRKYEDTIEVAPDEPITVNVDNEGEVELSFSYIYKPTGKVEEFRRQFKR